MRREAFIIDAAPSKISVRYTDVYVTRAFRKIGLALLDCLKRAEEVATEYMWDEIWSGWKDIDALKNGVNNVSNSSDLYP
jgi:hypothetical protein